MTSLGAGHDSYVFDAANRMTAVSGKESYAYDGYGRRVKVTRTTDGKTDYPIYTMTGQLLTEDDARSGLTTDYVSLNGSLVAKRSAPLGTSTWSTTYEHTDALHSPVAETNAGAQPTRIELYTPYGEPGDGQYVQGPGYTGHVTDAATGLTYAQQRYYWPLAGRFLSPDPVQADDRGGDFNRYAYAGNNPYKFTDPDGRYECVGSKPDCEKVDKYVRKINESKNNLPRQDARRVQKITNYLGSKGKGGPIFTPTTLDGKKMADTDQRGNIKVDVNKSMPGVDNATSGGISISHEADHDIYAKANGEAHTPEAATASEKSAYGMEATVARGLGIFISQSQIDAGVKGSVEAEFGPEPPPEEKK